MEPREVVHGLEAVGHVDPLARGQFQDHLAGLRLGHEAHGHGLEDVVERRAEELLGQLLFVQVPLARGDEGHGHFAREGPESGQEAHVEIWVSRAELELVEHEGRVHVVLGQSL